MTYQTLSQPCTAVYEIKKSKFLAFAYPISDKEEIMFHVKQLRQLYPDARHHCLAYILGDPNNTTHAGFDDDGEPNGTAGRPMLNVLQHKAIGNVLVVVVRYFGGIKLGAGGLTRAYSTAVGLLVDKMDLVYFVAQTSLSLLADFADEARVRYLVAQAQGEIVLVEYQQQVKLKIKLAQEKQTNFINQLPIATQILSDDE
ncbi:MAG: YigZ family protein [Moraxella sp.]